MSRFRSMATCMAACVCVLAACERSHSRVAEPPPPPIKLLVNVDKPSITVGDLIGYTITVDAVTNVWYVMPQFAENLGGFVVSDWDPGKTEALKDGRVRHTQTYKMETYLTGMYEIPPARVMYARDGVTNALISTPICVEVRSVAQTNDLFSGIRDIKLPVELPEARKNEWRKWAIAAVGIAALVATTVLLATHFIRRARKPAPPVPAHEIAYAALRALLGKELVEAGLVKEYYIELSGILRHYIENRFGLRAPERTTEEFLQELGGTSAFVDAHRQLLAAFLAECDLVKFAKHGATPTDAQRAHDGAVSFIEETRERPDAAAQEVQGS